MCGLFRQQRVDGICGAAVVPVLRVGASWLSRHARSLPLRVRAHAARRAPTDRPCVTALSSARSHVTTLARRARASRAFSAAFGRTRSSRIAARRARLFGRPRRLPGASFLARHAQHDALEEVLAFIGFEALLLVVRVVVRIVTAVSRRSRRGAARRSAVSCVGACCLIWAYSCILAYSFVCETSTY